MRGALTRRGFLQGAGGVALASFLAACGTSGTSKSASTAADRAAPDLSDTDKLINWSNWPEYIDVDDKTKKRPTLEDFTKKTGIEVRMRERRRGHEPREELDVPDPPPPPI